MTNTSIHIDRSTRERLAQLKAGPRETYDEVINKLLMLVPPGDEEGEYAHAFRVGWLNARLQTVTGELIPHDEVRRRLGL